MDNPERTGRYDRSRISGEHWEHTAMDHEEPIPSGDPLAESM